MTRHRCPTCGRMCPSGKPKTEWVDGPAFLKLLEPHIAWGTPSVHNHPTRINGVAVIAHCDDDMELIYRLRNGRTKRTKATRAEAILTRFRLDPHVDDILIQD